HGGHSRYCLQATEEEHLAYLQRYQGRRRILYRGIFDIASHGRGGHHGGAQQQNQHVVNVNPGFICSLKLTDQITVDDEHLVNDFAIVNSPLRESFWKTGRAGSMHRTTPSMSDNDAASLLGIDPYYSSPQLLALIEENRHIISDRVDEVHRQARMFQVRHSEEIKRKRAGMTPSFLIDVFSPGPESFHVVRPSPDETPVIPATPQMYVGNNPRNSGATAVGGGGFGGGWNDWGKSYHGRLSYIPTLEQLERKLSADEENKYVKDIMMEHRHDIQLLYERLRNLVPSESNDPLKSAWYLFWDDIYRRYAPEIRQLKEHEADFNPLYPDSLPYNPLPRHRLEVFLHERGLWKPAGTALAVKGLLGKKATGAKDAEMFPVDPMPVEDYAVADRDGGAQIWRAGDDEAAATANPFKAGTAATGFIHSGLLNRLYCWLDQLAYSNSMQY
ncbi:hypothetical protein FBU59_002235, partial [Linderina macrospora]